MKSRLRIILEVLLIQAADGVIKIEHLCRDLTRTLVYKELWVKKRRGQMGELIDKCFDIFAIRQGNEDIHAKNIYKLSAQIKVAYRDHRIKPPTPHRVGEPQGFS